MTTDPITLSCDYCGAPPGSRCTKGGYYRGDGGATRPHKCRRYDACITDLIEEAKNSPAGTDLGDAWQEIRSNGFWGQATYLEAVKWMQKRS